MFEFDISKTAPISFNMELNTSCPFACPQCYCQLGEEKKLSYERAKSILKEAAMLGVSEVSLSGGEIMLYPHLQEVVAYAHSLGINTCVALSGWGFDTDVLQQLIDNGVNEIYISLNGSTKEVNSQSRDGYEYAIEALSVLKESDFENYYINWVAQSSNADDFEELARLARAYNVKAVVVMGLRPDSDNSMGANPSFEQVKRLADTIYRLNCEKRICVYVEQCYTELRNYMAVKNYDVDYGFCPAQMNSFAVSVNGRFMPCRHIDIEEDYDSIEDYLKHSSVLRTIKESKNHCSAKCLKCGISDKCSPCTAMAYKLEHIIKKSHVLCRLSCKGDM